MLLVQQTLLESCFVSVQKGVRLAIDTVRVLLIPGAVS